LLHPLKNISVSRRNDGKNKKTREGEMAFKHIVCTVGIGSPTTHHTVHAGMLYSIGALGIYDYLHTRNNLRDGIIRIIGGFV
jgi:hypothetical protein